MAKKNKLFQRKRQRKCQQNAKRSGQGRAGRGRGKGRGSVEPGEERKELSHLGQAHNDSPLKYYQIEAIDLSASGEKSAEKPRNGKWWHSLATD